MRRGRNIVGGAAFDCRRRRLISLSGGELGFSLSVAYLRVLFIRHCTKTLVNQSTLNSATELNENKPASICLNLIQHVQLN